MLEITLIILLIINLVVSIARIKISKKRIRVHTHAIKLMHGLGLQQQQLNELLKQDKPEKHEPGNGNKKSANKARKRNT